MNVSEMSDQEKSVVLARLCGWRVEHLPENKTESSWSRGFYFIADEKGNRIKHPVIHERGSALTSVPYDHPIELEHFKLFDLYDPANMALAWRVVSWLCKPSVAIVPNHDDWRFYAGLKFRVWFTKYDIEYITDDTPQRAWLDKILELAIAAGMVTE